MAAIPTKLLLHISDRDKWPVALELVHSLLKSAPQGHFRVIIVADVFAGGVCLACHPKLKERLEDLVAAGHRICVCAASLQILNLRTENLPEFVTIIPNSLVEIPARLAEGYQYLKI